MLMNNLASFFQDFLLHHMGLSPASEKQWPLTVSQRCLGVLARILLSRQQKNKRNGPQGMDIAECISIWKRLIDTLRNKSLPKDCLYRFEGEARFWLLSLVDESVSSS